MKQIIVRWTDTNKQKDIKPYQIDILLEQINDKINILISQIKYRQTRDRHTKQTDLPTDTQKYQ